MLLLLEQHITKPKRQCALPEQSYIDGSLPASCEPFVGWTTIHTCEECRFANLTIRIQEFKVGLVARA